MLAILSYEPVLGQIEVVEEPHVDLAGQAQLGDLRAHVIELVLRQRDAARLDAVVLRGPEDQAAPAAADVEQGLAGLEHQLAADVIELLRLRLVERVGWRS